MEVCVGVKGRGESVCEIFSSIEWFIVINCKVGNLFSSRTKELRIRRYRC